MASENHPPSINNLLDQGFDLQYFNPPAEYPIPLENDWYAQFIKGEIRVVNPPPKEPKKGLTTKPARLGSASKTLRKEPLPRTTSPLKDRTQQQQQQHPRTPAPSSQENPKKRPTVSEIDTEDSPSPDLNTEILQQVQDEVAKEILTKHKAEVEEGIQKRVAAHVLKQVPKGYGDLQSVEFDEEEYLDHEEKRRQKEREKAQKAANVRRRSWK